MNYCSPNNNTLDISSHYTCFALKELQEIAIAFNIYIHNNNICTKKNTCVPKKLIDIQNKDKKELWYSIYNRLKPICKYEYCWIDLEFINLISDKNLQDKIKYFTFKPKMTKTKYSWLSNNDINSILQQYQKLNTNFYYFGALPSDFYKIKTIDYTNFNKFDLIGIVLNLDKHNENGSHWVTLVIDNITKTIEYFDSVGNKPNYRIDNFVKLLRTKYLKNYKHKINKVVHQSKDTECGIYSIYYIIQRLYGKTFDEITQNIIHDDDMNKFRKFIFRPNKYVTTDKNKIGGFDKKKAKFPRKWSEEYCESTPCKKMGFSQKSSCRYYKNCYI